MRAPALYIDTQTATAVQVKEAFVEALSDDLIENIEEVECAYDLLSDSIDFIVKRRRDGMRAKLPVFRALLRDPSPMTVVAALKAEPEAFARLVLFLA